MIMKGGNNMRIFVSAGHGGSDPGAVGNGLLEKDCNLYIALSFGKTLESVGLDVIYSRTCDENDPVTQEVIEANHCQANYAISFHNNAGGAIGSETWIWPGDSKAMEIATALEKVTTDSGVKSRGVKTTTSLYFIRNTAMTAVLNETAFIDNKTDSQRINTPDKCADIGRRYAYAFLEVIGIQNNIIQNSENVPRETFQIKAKNKKLYVYGDTDRNSKVTYTIEDKRRYTIVDTKVYYERNERWFKLKSGIGWVNADDVNIVGE